MANRAEADAGGKPGPAPRKPRCPSEDVSLLERLRQGDHEALKTVAAREWLPVYRRVRCIVGNRHAAEDAVQETFLRFWARREKCGSASRTSVASRALLGAQGEVAAGASDPRDSAPNRSQHRE